MNKRTRKKWSKKHNTFVNLKDTWNLNSTIAEFVLPRLKLFKKVSNSYPGQGEVDTPEKWNSCLDKMILAFEYVLSEDNWWIDDPRYDYTDGLHLLKIHDENGFQHLQLMKLIG